MLEIAMPLLLHDEFDARETQPGELRLGIDPERNCIDLALVDQAGAGMAAELSPPRRSSWCSSWSGASRGCGAVRSCHDAGQAELDALLAAYAAASANGRPRSP